MSSRVNFSETSAYFARLRSGESRENIEREMLWPLSELQNNIFQNETRRVLALLQEKIEERSQENGDYLLDAERFSLTENFREEIQKSKNTLSEMKEKITAITSVIKESRKDFSEENERRKVLLTGLQKLQTILEDSPAEYEWINRQKLADWAGNFCK